MRRDFRKKYRDALTRILWLHNSYVLTEGKEGVRLDLSGRNLRDAIWSGADLSQGDFSDATFDYSDFTGAKALVARLRGADIYAPGRGFDAVIAASQDRPVHASNDAYSAQAQNSPEGYQAQLDWILRLHDQYAATNGREGIRLDLSGKEIRNALFRGADLSHGEFIETRLNNATFVAAKFRFVTLDRADIWAPLEGVDIPSRPDKNSANAFASANDDSYDPS